MVGRTPWSAADALVGLPAPYRILMSLFRQRDEGVPRGPGVRPSNPAAFRLLAFLDGHYAEGLAHQRERRVASKSDGLRDRGVGFGYSGRNVVIPQGIVAIRNTDMSCFTTCQPA